MSSTSDRDLAFSFIVAQPATKVGFSECPIRPFASSQFIFCDRMFPMIAPKRVQRVYDHRLRQFVCSTGDTAHALRIGVPRSTANGWLHPRERPVISLTQFGHHVEALETEVAKLQAQAAKLRHIVRLLFLILKFSGFSFENCRIPSSSDKSKLIMQIKKAANVIPLGCVLNVIGLSRSRFFAVTGRVVVAEPVSFRPSCYRSSTHLLHRQFGQPAAPRPRSPPFFPKHRNPPLPRLYPALF